MRTNIAKFSIILAMFCGVKTASVVSTTNASEWNQVDVGLHAVDLIEKYGYPVQEHFVTTEDGYILGVHRIPQGKDASSNLERIPVLIMHGLLSSSSDFVNMGNRSLAFILADLGYDVWLLNGRGNLYSRNHTTLDPDLDKKEFWDFSFHEIAVHDVPTTIDYILNVTHKKKVHYIGHSQGCTILVCLLTTKPEYNDKIKLASLMSPPIVFEHFSNPLYERFTEIHETLKPILDLFEFYEIPFYAESRNWSATHCDKPEFKNTCLFLLNTFQMYSSDQEQVDQSRLGVILTNSPAGSSFKWFVHSGQVAQSNIFRQFDYGPAENEQRYGTEAPPVYDLRKMVVPVAVYYSNGDEVVNYKDVEKFCRMVPNLAEQYRVPYEAFNHGDFLRALQVVPFLYNELVSVLKKY